MNSNRTLLKYWLTIWIMIAILSVSIFPLESGKPFDRYLLEEWNTQNNFPDYSVYDIVQTADGYLWLTTGKKLIRFDGTRFEHIPVENKWPDGIETLYVDRKGLLIVGGFNHLLVYQNRQFKALDEKNVRSPYKISCLQDDMYGNLWIGFVNGALSCYKDGKNILAKTFNSTITSIWEDNQGKLWFATFKDGLFTYRNGEFLKQNFHWLEKNLTIQTICQDTRGVYWFGTNQGLMGVENLGKGKTERVFSINTTRGLTDNRVTRINLDSNGNLWVATEKGLNRITWTPGEKPQVLQFLHGVQVTTCFEDKEKSLWIGTVGHQLKRLRNSTFYTLDNFPGFSGYRPVLFRDQRGDMIVGTGDGKLVRVKDEGYTVFFTVAGKRAEAIGAIAQDRHGHLWVGTSAGIVREIAGSGVVNRFDLTEKNSPDTTICTIYCDRHNRIWIGTNHGLYWLEKAKLHRYLSLDGIPQARINQVLEDKKGDFWIATEDGVLFIKDGAQDKQKNLLEHKLEHKWVFCIHEDEEEPGVFWFGTDGLVRLKQGKKTFFTSQQGLATDQVYHMVEDNQHNLWLSSMNGVLKVSKKNLQEVADGTKKRVDCQTFGNSDGIKVAQGWFCSTNSVQKTERGQLWFSMLLGIAVVNPDNIIINKIAPPVVLDAVLFNGVPISPDESDREFKGVENIYFSFKALTYVFQNRVRFKYRLEGFDEYWQELVGQQKSSILYRDLPFGAYTFRVMASNGSGIWNTVGVPFTFTLSPYYYQRTIFKLAIIFLVMCGGLAFFISIKRYLLLKHSDPKYKR